MQIFHRWLKKVFFVFFIFSVVIGMAQATEQQKVDIDKKLVVIDIDFMEGFEFKKPASQIVLGNPIIADITVRDDQYIFISGKSPGRTNMLVYGRDGKLSEQHEVVVRDPHKYLTVYSGPSERSNFDCEPFCQRVLRIEDTGAKAEEQRSKIAAQLEMIDGRAKQAKADELLEQQQRSSR